MFLVEWKKGNYIDLEKLEGLQVEDNILTFYMAADGGEIFYTVDSEYCEGFLNHLKCLDGGITNINQHYKPKGDKNV